MSLLFSNPYFLFLLPAAGVPILLHLISRGKPLKLLFPSIRFIKLGKVPSNEKRTLTDILLLIIRVLILLALTFFFAGPEINQKNLLSENKKCVIIFDSSISAFHNNYNQILIDKINDVIKKMGNQTSFFVIDSAHQIISSTKTDKTMGVISFLKNLVPHNQSPNHRQALQEASNFIGNEKSTLIIASLFDMVGFEQINNIIFSNETEVICLNAEIGKKNINILGVQFGKNNSDNILTRLTVKVVNESAIDFKGEIKIKFNEKTESKTLDLKPSQSGTIVFNSEIPPGSIIIVSTDNNDDYSPDNTYYCKSPQTPIVEFLLIHPEKPYNSESVFIEEVLNVSESNMTRINFNSITPEKFNFLEMKAPQFIMLSGCADFMTIEQLKTIKEWHKLGTHLIITPSEDFRRSYSALLSAGIITQTANSKFGNVNNSIPVFFNNINEKSPYTSIFLKDGINDFISIPILQYIKINHLKNTEVLLTTENDDPILVINRLGSGICFLFTIALDPAWSDLPLTSTFLPLTRQIVNVSIQNNIKKSEEYVTPATLIKTNKEDESYLFNNEQILISEKSRGEFLELTKPGVYQMASQAYIVNNSRKHSHPDILSAFELKNSLLNNSKKSQKVEAKNEQNSSLKNYLLYLILLLIFLEIFLHNDTFKLKKEVLI